MLEYRLQSKSTDNLAVNCPSNTIYVGVTLCLRSKTALLSWCQTIPLKEQFALVYAGVTEGRARGGVGIMVAERWGDCIRSWRCVNERCVMVRLKIERVGITLVQVYAPTDDKANDTKEEFYAALQEVIARAQRGDKVVVMGDLNARVRNNVLRWSDAMGKHDEEVENDSGRRLLRFCVENELRIMNTHFEHKKIHKFTWKCPGRGLQSIIDYFLVREDMKRIVNDVRVIRGAEIGSDHHLVVMKVKLTKRPQMGQEVRRRDNRRQHLKRWKLKEKDVQWRFRLRLESRLDRARQREGEQQCRGSLRRVYEEHNGNSS